MENQGININEEEIIETVEAQPKSLREIATETGGVLLPPSQTIRHDH
jgi:hypothetical protein